MKHLWLLLALLFATPSDADTITITITAASGANCTSGCTKTYTDATNVLVADIISGYQQHCNMSINGVCTTAQVLNYFAGIIKGYVVTDVTNSALTTLQNNAVSGYTPVNPQ